MSFGGNFCELRDEHVELGGGIALAGLVDKAWVTGSLAETEECFEYLEACLVDAFTFDRVEDGLAVVSAELVVEFALFGFHFAVDGLFYAWWKILCNLIFGSSENEWADCICELFVRLAIDVVGDGALEVASCAKHAWVEEFEE